jgi:hypothetical protein
MTVSGNQGYDLRRYDTVCCDINMCVCVSNWTASYTQNLSVCRAYHGTGPEVCLATVLTPAIRYVWSVVGRRRGQTGSAEHQVCNYVTATPTVCFLCMDNQGARRAERPGAVSVNKNIHTICMRPRKFGYPLSAQSRLISVITVTKLVYIFCINILDHGDEVGLQLLYPSAWNYGTNAGLLFVHRASWSKRQQLHFAFRISSGTASQLGLLIGFVTSCRKIPGWDLKLGRKQEAE